MDQDLIDWLKSHHDGSSNVPPFGKPIAVKGKLTISEANALLRVQAPGCRVVFFAMIGLAAIVVLGLASHANRSLRSMSFLEYLSTFLSASWVQVAVVVGVVCYFVSLFFIRRSTKQAYLEGKGVFAEHTLEFTDRGVQVATKSAERRWVWSAFTSLKGDDSRLILYVDAHPVVNVVRSWLPSDAEWFRLVIYAYRRLVPDVYDALVDTDSAEQVRMKSLEREKEFKGYVLALIGMFILISMPFATLLCGLLTGRIDATGHTVTDFVIVVIYASALMSSTVAGIALYLRVRRFVPRSRRMLTTLACIALIIFPIGTYIGGRILFSIYDGDPPRLFTIEYEGIVKRTLHVRRVHKTSIVAWFCLFAIALIVLLILFSIIIQKSLS